MLTSWHSRAPCGRPNRHCNRSPMRFNSSQRLPRSWILPVSQSLLQSEKNSTVRQSLSITVVMVMVRWWWCWCWCCWWEEGGDWRRLEEEEEEAGNDQMSPPRLMPSWTSGELAWQRRTRPNFFAAVPKAVGWCGAESLVIGMDQDGISSWGCPLEHRSTQKVKELVRSSRDSTWKSNNFLSRVPVWVTASDRQSNLT